MGRPSLVVESSRRPNTRNSDEEPPTFPRRFPRMGGNFQVKCIPDQIETYVSSRPQPSPMSQDVPYCSVEEVKSGAYASTDAASTPWSFSRSSTSGSLGNHEQGSRFQTPFPFPVHELENATDESSGDNKSASSSSSIITTRRRARSSEIICNDTFDQWVENLCQWQNAQRLAVEKQQQQPRRKARNGKKRPLARTDLPLPKRAAVMSGEEAAAFDAWRQSVSLGGGRMCSALRIHNKKKKSRVWRDMFERVSIRGDLRGNTRVPCKFSELDPGGQRKAMEVWKAVISLCEALDSQLRQAQGNQCYLSQALILLDFCNRLPDPNCLFEKNPHETTAKDIDDGLNGLLKHIDSAQAHQSRLLDLWHASGADTESLRKAVIAAKDCPLQLDELSELQRQVGMVASWQRKVDGGLTSLEVAKELVEEGSALGFESKGLVQLRTRLEKVEEVRSRVQKWTKSTTKESLKHVAGLVREVQRLKCPFAEAEKLLSVHQDSEAWIDRSSIAIRNKMSMTEMEELVERGGKMPLDVSDLLEKLRARISLGQDWVNRFEQHVPKPLGVSPGSSEFMFQWMRRIRLTLQESDGEDSCVASTLQDLVSEGARLPIHLDCVTLLQIEIEARNWSSKTKKWETKRPKLDDIKEHIAKGKSLRERLGMMSDDHRDAWILEGEKEALVILEQASSWLQDYHSIFDGPLPLRKLKDLAEACDRIPANMGSPSLQMTKILNQAQEWFDKYAALIKRCQGERVTISEVRSAVDAASKNLQVELHEACHLQSILSEVQAWTNQVQLATGVKRRGKKCSFCVDDLVSLIEKSKALPVDTTSDVGALQEELGRVREWQQSATSSLVEIASAFNDLSKALKSKYGTAESFDRKKALFQVENACSSHESVTPPHEVASKLQSMAESFGRKANSMTVSTPEAELAPLVESASRWCNKSQKYLEYQRDIFDKRFFGAFDRFVSDGKKLRSKVDHVDDEDKKPNLALDVQIKKGVMMVVVDQIKRLETILGDREKYIKWSKQVENTIYSDEKRPTVEKIKDACKMGQEFPNECDLVQKLRRLREEVVGWTNRAKEALARESLSHAEAKALCDDSDKLGFISPEVKKLRNAIKLAKTWTTKVKKSKVDQGNVHVKDVQNLILEHSALLIKMPEELAKLRQAVKNYCICRRPYDGFMIGCDDCGEWFHGPCVGVSESKADKYDKYTCVRCCTVQSFKACGVTMASVVKKWTCRKELKRSRQVQAQKHQRKVRKETKLIEKAQEQMTTLRAKIPPANPVMPMTGQGIPQPPDIKQPANAELLPIRNKSGSNGFLPSINVPIGMDQKPDDVGSTAEAKVEPLVSASHNAGLTANAAAVVRKSEALTLPTGVTGGKCPLVNPVLVTPTEADSASKHLDGLPMLAEQETNSKGLQSGVEAKSADVPPKDRQPAHTHHAECCRPEGCDANILAIAVDNRPTSARPEEVHHTMNGRSLLLATSKTESERTQQANADIEQAKPEVLKPIQAQPSGLKASGAKIADSKVSVEIAAKLNECENSIDACNDRLRELEHALIKRKEMYHEEDVKADIIRKFCLRVRSRVVAPSTQDRALASRPSRKGELSSVIQSLREEAKSLGLERFDDIRVLMDSFDSMSWVLNAMYTLSRRPSAEEMIRLVERTKTLKLPDEKVLRFIRTAAQRATNWQNKVNKVLAPDPEESKPFDLNAIRDLLRASEDIPLTLPYESRLLAVLDDNGKRHCICGGPSDGRLMLCCDDCKLWFHAQCMGATTEDAERDEWRCLSCAGSDPRMAASFSHADFKAVGEGEYFDDSDTASKAPDPLEQWPPLGLLGSDESKKALGELCCQIPDSEGELPLENGDLSPTAPIVTNRPAAHHCGNGSSSLIPASVAAALSSLPVQALNVLAARRAPIVASTSTIEATNSNNVSAVSLPAVVTEALPQTIEVPK